MRLFEGLILPLQAEPIILVLLSTGELAIPESVRQLKLTCLEHVLEHKDMHILGRHMLVVTQACSLQGLIKPPAEWLNEAQAVYSFGPALRGMSLLLIPCRASVTSYSTTCHTSYHMRRHNRPRPTCKQIA